MWREHVICSRTMLALVLSGILVTTQNGTELARESWRDDGKVVTSDITGRRAEGQAHHRSQASRTCTSIRTGTAIDVPIAPGTAALMNMHWAAYGMLARAVQGRARSPTPFKAIIGPNRIIDATVKVVPAAATARAK